MSQRRKLIVAAIFLVGSATGLAVVLDSYGVDGTSGDAIEHRVIGYIAPIPASAALNNAETLGLSATQQGQLIAVLQSSSADVHADELQILTLESRISNFWLATVEADIHLSFDLNAPASQVALQADLASRRQLSQQVATTLAGKTRDSWAVLTPAQRQQLLEILGDLEAEYKGASHNREVLLHLPLGQFATLFSSILTHRQQIGLSATQETSLHALSRDWSLLYMARAGAVRAAAADQYEAIQDRRWGSSSETKFQEAADALLARNLAVADASSDLIEGYTTAWSSALGVLTQAQLAQLVNLLADERTSTSQAYRNAQTPGSAISSGFVVNSVTEPQRLAALQALQQAAAAISAPNPSQAQLDQAARMTRDAQDILER